MRNKPFHYLFGLGLCLSQLCFSQNSTLLKFIPSGYEIRDTLSGDLNADGRNDLLLILKLSGEDTISSVIGMARPMLILIRQADGSLKLASRNDEAVLTRLDGGPFGDPYQKMTIDGDCFTVEHYGGSTDRWSDVITFKFNKTKKNWFLFSSEYYLSNAYDPEKDSKTTKTTKDFGLIEFSKFKRDILN
jgi:hypothetical protein